MLPRNLLISAMIIVIILASLFFLVQVSFNNYDRLMPSSKPRLNCFVIVHLIIVSMMVWFTRIEHTYQYVTWGFVLSGSIVFVVTAVQVYVAIERLNGKNYDLRVVQPIQLAYLNCYFIIYMYSLITCFFSGMFLCLTKFCIFIRKKRVQNSIRQNIFPIQNSEEQRANQCSICLEQFKQEDQLLQVKCKHIFHRDCLLQWVKQKQSCPTCRFSIFQYGNIQQGLLASLF